MKNKIKPILIIGLISALAAGCGKKDVVDFTGKEGIAPPVRRTEEDGSEGLYEIDPNLFKQDYKIVFVNTSGKDLEKLNVTFSADPDSVIEILGGKQLNDGSLVEYSSDILEKMSGQNNLKISVKAETKKEGELDFGTAGLLDLSDTTLILDKDKDGWVLHMD
ncbi:MAG: hypothetical protein K5686_04005 [Lachnospiraceae bacterium]|nr:hypothetical protein [Lachnospiraceae bacterium]